MADPETRFDDQKAWLAHLDRLGLTALGVTPDPVRVASEGALWGSVQVAQIAVRCRRAERRRRTVQGRTACAVLGSRGTVGA